MLNQLLGGHYLVVQALGEGGLAKTYIAEDHHRPGHPKCVVKYLKPASNAPGFLPTARRLFNKEAEILERLGKHDQIPRLLAYFEQKQEFYLVQEFIEGHTLSKELPLGHRWSENKVIQMLTDVLQTLEFVHSYRVIHRDIKPSNLIRRQKDNRLVLIDFGAVKQVRNPNITTRVPLSQKTISIGTQGYIPTEQVRGKPRLNSDIYALGMIGIQALTGIHPLHLKEDADGEIMWQNRAEVSDELAAILTQMVCYHFKERYQSITEVLQALKLLGNQDKLIQSTLDTRKASPEVTVEPNLQEAKVSLDINPWNLEAIPKFDLRETKVSLGMKHSDAEAIPEPELGKTKVALDIKQPTSKVAVEPELRETNVSLNIDPWNLEAASEPKLQEKKVVPKLGKLTSELASEQTKKRRIVSPASSLAPSKDLELDRPSIFVHLNKYRPFIGIGIVSVLVSIFAGYTYMNHRQSYLQAQKALEQIEVLKTTEKYQGCVQQARTFPKDYSDLQAKAATLLHECKQGQAARQLAEAKKLADQERFKEAIALATQVSTDTDVYSEAQQFISQWSEKIFQVARHKYQEGNLEEATAIAKTVPKKSPLAAKIQATIKRWNQEWEQNQTNLQAAQEALDERRWQDAIDTAEKVSSTEYWQKQSEPIIKKAKAEIAATKTPIPASKKTYSAPRKTYKPSSSSYTRKSFPKRKPIPSTAPFPISRPGSTSVRSTPTQWTCLNNPNPKCHK